LALQETPHLAATAPSIPYLASFGRRASSAVTPYRVELLVRAPARPALISPEGGLRPELAWRLGQGGGRDSLDVLFEGRVLLDAIESSLAVLVIFATTAAVLSFLRPAARQAQ
jgi:hypothetical protein